MSATLTKSTLDLPNEAPLANDRTPARAVWVDNLRAFTILFVVSMHACVTYSHVGSWYYNSEVQPSTLDKIVFILYQGHLQAFFMGLLFFLGGYFADRSLAKKGMAGFLKERVWRLGAPTLLFIFVLAPLTFWFMKLGGVDAPSNYWQFLLRRAFVGTSGPLWFACALLVFSFVFALIPTNWPWKIQPKLTPAMILGLGAFLGVASFVVRLVQPVGTDFYNFQLCYFAQYVVAFGLGVWISRTDALQKIASSSIAAKAGIAAAICGPLAIFTVVAFFKMPASGGPSYYDGGWNLAALGEALWEQMAGVGLALGAMALAYRKANFVSPVTKLLSDNAFGVYVIHTPVLVGLSLLLRPVMQIPLLSALAMTLIAFSVSLAITWAIRKLRIVRAVI